MTIPVVDGYLPSIIDNHIPNTDFSKFNLNGNTQDEYILNIIAADGSYNIVNSFNPRNEIKKFPKTSRGIGGKKPGDDKFSISSHITFLEKLKLNNRLFKEYLYKYEHHLKLDLDSYIMTLKNIYYYDIYSTFYYLHALFSKSTDVPHIK
jgi:hypothetical protein